MNLKFCLCFLTVTIVSLNAQIEIPPNPPPMDPSFLSPMPIGIPPHVQPPINPMCADDDGRSNINETCAFDFDCVPGLQCFKNLCRCRFGTFEMFRDLGSLGNRAYCQQAPQFNQICSSVCMPPMVCVNRRCKCPEGLKFVGGTCYKDCPAGTFFVRSQGICRQRCKEDEVKIDEECKPTALLGEKCESTRQCQTAFSWCQNNSCTCKSGFTAQGNDSCVTQLFSCPNGEPLMNNGAVVRCERKQILDMSPLDILNLQGPLPQKKGNVQQGFGGGASFGPAPQAVGFGRSSSMIMPPNQFYKFEDSCPSTHMCQIQGGSPGSTVQQGHCCPKPKQLKCPMGEPLRDVTCGPMMGGFAGNPTKRFCPQQTHMCMFGGSPDGKDEPLCCPMPCNSHEDFYFDGKCHQAVNLDDKCQYDEQCNRHNGVCKNGVCKCPENAAVQSGNMAPGPMPFMGPPGFTADGKFCEIRCKMTEFQFDGKCYPRQKIGDKCSSDMVCPHGARCKNGICACHCNLQQFGDSFCAQPPFCNNINNVPFMTPKPEKNPLFCTVKSNRQGAPQQSLDAEEMRDLNVTDVCPGNLYCSGHYRTVGNLALCCPKPDPICPSGTRPSVNDRCDPRNPRGCPNGFCHRYFHPADPTSTEGFICCSMSFPSNQQRPLG